jgi:hypothetical protein
MTHLQAQSNERHCCSHRSYFYLPLPYRILADWRMEEELDFEGSGSNLPFPYEVLERGHRGTETTWKARLSRLPFSADALQYWRSEIKQDTMLRLSGMG